MRLFGVDSYTKLPDEREAMRWPYATVASLEKLRRRTSWLSRHWSWRTVVLNAAGHLIVYRSLHTGRVYALPTARKVAVSIKPKLALLHVVDQAGHRVTLRVRGQHAAQWAAQVIRYASHTNVQERSQRQAVDIMQQDKAVVQASVVPITLADKSNVQTVIKSVSRTLPAVQRNVSARKPSWLSLLLSNNRDGLTVETRKPSTLEQSVINSSKTTVVAEVYPQPGGRFIAASRSSTLLSSEETGQTVVPMRSRSLSVIETIQQQQQQQQQEAVEPMIALTPVRSLSADDGGQRANFVRQLSAILQRQIDSEVSACTSTTSALSFSEFKTRGTVQIYRPPPSPPPVDRGRLCGPSPMLSPDFLRQLRAARRS